MAILFQAACFAVLVGMISCWVFPTVVERHGPITYVHTSIEESSGPFTIFDEMNKIMSRMHERFEHMFNWPSVPFDFYDNGDYDTSVNEDQSQVIEDLIKNEPLVPVAIDDLTEIRKKLDMVQPVCTTVTNTPTTISPRKSRRKKLRATQTTTCVRELIHNGEKHISEEINTTDDKGVVIQHVKNYSMMTLNKD
ncbi:unnamed protein product [Adineta ricciae]|uniref:Uncharacterized protein n=1 Tax=Adineta ricciae TaxID=249248 RepID=A0A814GAA2_ADIRI|nr:unnamed protein product [Adineta ricciae]CAF0991621.1 unnamed protein product [Adineta ricciae]